MDQFAIKLINAVYAGYSQKEIGIALNCSLAKVDATLKAVRQEFQKEKELGSHTDETTYFFSQELVDSFIAKKPKLEEDVKALATIEAFKAENAPEPMPIKPHPYSDQWDCPKCKESLSDRGIPLLANFCPHCGQKLIWQN